MIEYGFLTVSGPTGSGKTTLIARLLESFPAYHPLTCQTTRQPRPSDIREQYCYVSDEIFERYICNMSLMWWHNVHGYRNGALKIDVDEALRHGYCIADTSYDAVEILFGQAMKYGVLSLMRCCYLDISDEEELRRRLQERGEVNIEKRVAECRQWGKNARASRIPFCFIDACQPPTKVLSDAIAYFSSQ